MNKRERNKSVRLSALKRRLAEKKARREVDSGNAVEILAELRRKGAA